MGSIFELPTWLENRYLALFTKFEKREFRLEDAVKLLGESPTSDKEADVITVLSELRKAELLETKPDSKDARKKIYVLRRKEEIIGDALQKGNLSRSDIEAILKKAADLIRTRVDYKFILILLFMKRISDKWQEERDKALSEALKDGLTKEQAENEAKQSIYHQFDMPEEYLWEEIAKDVAHLPEKFSKALKTIAERNPEFKDVIDNADFIQFTSNNENAEILRQLVELFSANKLHHVSPDILGDAYEWILRYFAPDKAKEGEVYTPREVIQLIVEILDPKPGESVYDGACGSGGMLISAFKHVEEKNGLANARKLFLYGQEANPKTLALGKMNLYIHDIRDAQLAFGDTLLYPKFKDGEKVKNDFNVVIANPPWNQDGYDETVIKKGEAYASRFSYGFAPKQSADWMWNQHLLFSCTGRAGIIFDNGCLFRGGKERAIRQKVLEDDLLECVILLPEKLFYNTGAPGTILIFNKNKKESRKGRVLFINASSEYEQHPDVRKLNKLGEKNIKRIVGEYGKFSDADGFVKVVSIEEIRKNDYNLNVTLYAFPIEEEEEIDVSKEWKELLEIEREIDGQEKKIEGYLEEIK
ncbi:MAG: type I restriction-modification system subunit M [Candidatus Bilamarchaeaceae archaeon]